MTISQSIFATQERRQRIARLYLQRKMQSEIARDVGISQQQVSYDLRVLRKLWLASSLQDFDARKSEELQRVDTVELAAWEGWARSLLPREITLTETTLMDAAVPATPAFSTRKKRGRPAKRKASLRKEGQAGDPRFLQCIQKCIDQRCAILGLGVEQESLKTASLGLAGLLDHARHVQALESPPPPLAEA